MLFDYKKKRIHDRTKSTDPSAASAPTSRGDSYQNGVRKAICYALASSSIRAIKLATIPATPTQLQLRRNVGGTVSHVRLPNTDLGVAFFVV